MVPDRAFFTVQRRFAERWAAIASVPIETAYLECTTWYRQAAGLGRDFDAEHPTWQELVAVVRNAADPDGVVHAAAVRNEPEVSSGPVLDWSWEAEDQTVRIHFIGERSLDGHPLARWHLPERQHELRDLVRGAALEHPEAAWLRGRSPCRRRGRSDERSPRPSWVTSVRSSRNADGRHAVGASGRPLLPCQGGVEGQSRTRQSTGTNGHGHPTPATMARL